MNPGKWRFRPTLWPTLAALIMFVILLRLGVWQLHRADYKRALQQQYSQSERLPPLDINQMAADGRLSALQRYRHVRAHGHYDAAHQLLLQDMQHDDQVGYEVLSPFILEPGQQIVMVDRGWLSMTGNDNKTPELSLSIDSRDINGVAGILPVPGIRLGQVTMPAGWPKMLLYPDYPALMKLYGDSLLHPVIWLDASQPDGYVRDWRPDVGFPPIRHLAYALQWFALAAALAVIWMVVNLKRGRKHGKHERN
jgi:surfeit locus 1 family protein